MQFTICEKHHRVEKSIQRVTTCTTICMKRSCPTSFSFLCPQCRIQHKDHQSKLLTLEDIRILSKRLRKTPTNQIQKHFTECIGILRKIKLFKDFRKRLDFLQTDLIKQAGDLIQETQTLINQFCLTKQAVQNLQQHFGSISNIENFKKFKEQSKNLFSEMEYNEKKERLEFSNPHVKQKQQKRSKALQRTKLKIDEVRDYSMKIIEVFLHHEQTQSEDQNYQDSMNIKKNIYKKLKQQLNIGQKDQAKQAKQIKQIQDDDNDEQASKSTTVSTHLRRKFINNILDAQTQTNDKWILQLKQESINCKNNLEQFMIQYQQMQNSLLEKLAISSDQLQKRDEQNSRLIQQIENIQRKFEEMRKDKTKLQVQKSLLDKDVQKYKGFVDNLNNYNRQIQQKLSGQKTAMKEFENRLRLNIKQKKVIQKEKQSIFREIISIYNSK